MVQPGRILWCWELNNPCTGSAIANLPAPLSAEEARRCCKGEKRSSYGTNVMPIPREAIRMSPDRSCLHVTCDPAPQSLALGAGCGCRQDGQPSAAASVAAGESQPTRAACAAARARELGRATCCSQSTGETDGKWLCVSSDILPSNVKVCLCKPCPPTAASALM